LLHDNAGALDLLGPGGFSKLSSQRRQMLIIRIGY